MLTTRATASPSTTAFTSSFDSRASSCGSRAAARRRFFSCRGTARAFSNSCAWIAVSFIPFVICSSSLLQLADLVRIAADREARAQTRLVDHVDGLVGQEAVR